MILNDKGKAIESTEVVPKLTESQQQAAESRASVPALVVHETVRRNGDEELARPLVALAWSGLAAGMSMGFSFLAEALLASHLPDAGWRPLISSLGYPLGFLVVIIGRQQLFTENTLTAIIPLLADRTRATLVKVAKLWATVLAANLVGVHIFAWVVAATPMMTPQVKDAMQQLATQAADVSAGTAALRGIFAGWLIAMVVWMLAAGNASRIAIIVVLTYIVGLANLTHVIVGSAEVLFLVMTGAKSWLSYFGSYFLPTLAGNIVGGVALVSALNHAQVIAGKTPAPKLAESGVPAKAPT